MPLPKKAAPIISVAAITVLAAMLILAGRPNIDLSGVFEVDATYFEDQQYVEVTFADSTGQTTSVVLEILGLPESYQKVFEGHEFVERVRFESEPANGWRAHPLIFAVEGADGSIIEIKTEVHAQGEPAPHVIYSLR